MTYIFPPSPESEVFSTPPTSPMPIHVPSTSAATSLRPTGNRGGRPARLLLDPSKAASNSFQPSITLEGPTLAHSLSIPDIQEQTAVRGPSVMSINETAMKSPCFVHSQLEKGASLVDWLKNTHIKGNVNVAKSLGSPRHAVAASPAGSLHPEDGEDDEAFSNSLTRQLAETAVGVREMSKALGRARVHSDLNSVLIITKARDNRLVKLTRELALYLMQKQRPSTDGGHRRLIVYVDAQLQTSKRFDVEGMQRDYPELFAPVPKRRSSASSVISTSSHAETNGDVKGEEGQLRYWTADMCSRSPHLFDFVVTLGGDGTVLFTSWLFQRIVPPVLPFALGSLGFLTNFDFSDHKAVMDAAIDSGIRVNLRMRFTCTVYRAVAPEHCTKKRKAVKKAETGEILMKDVEQGGWEAIESGYNAPNVHGKKDKEIMCFTTRPVESFEVLNDLVVDRGPSPYVSLLELFGDEHHMTTVQADGLVVATPTGSTAYSLSAGGSLVHPEIPALLISPICPHTLSFRPMLLPDTMELRICVPYNSRSTAWASFDGRGRVELKQGDHIKITASKYPFPTVCADKQSTDWFHAISRTLKWNERERQKSFVMVEEGPAKATSGKRVSTPPTGMDGLEGSLEEGDEEDEESEEEEEEKFDIDDSSTAPPSGTNSAAPSTPNTPAHSRIQSNANLAMTVVDTSTSETTSIASTTGLDGEIDMQVDGARDNIHSPKSLLHNSKSKIPKDRDVDSMLTPRPSDTVHPQNHPRHQHTSHHHHHHHHPHVPAPTSRFGLSGTLNHVPHLSRGRQHNGVPGHRSSRSVDFAAGNRAFACWGQDESDSNTDSEP